MSKKKSQKTGVSRVRTYCTYGLVSTFSRFTIKMPFLTPDCFNVTKSLLPNSGLGLFATQAIDDGTWYYVMGGKVHPFTSDEEMETFIRNKERKKKAGYLVTIGAATPFTVLDAIVGDEVTKAGRSNTRLNGTKANIYSFLKEEQERLTVEERRIVNLFPHNNLCDNVLVCLQITGPLEAGEELYTDYMYATNPSWLKAENIVKPLSKAEEKINAARRTERFLQKAEHMNAVKRQKKMSKK